MSSDEKSWVVDPSHVSTCRIRSNRTESYKCNVCDNKYQTHLSTTTVVLGTEAQTLLLHNRETVGSHKNFVFTNTVRLKSDIFFRLTYHADHGMLSI